MVEGIARARIINCWQDKPFLVLQVEQIEEDESEHHSARAEAVIRTTYELMEHYCELSTKVSSDIMLTVIGSQKPGYMADYIAQNISIRGEDKQAILEELRPVRRLEKMNQILRKEVRVLEIEKDMETKIRDHMNEAQKDYYLREQPESDPERTGRT